MKSTWAKVSPEMFYASIPIHGLVFNGDIVKNGFEEVLDDGSVVGLIERGLCKNDYYLDVKYLINK